VLDRAVPNELDSVETAERAWVLTAAEVAGEVVPVEPEVPASVDSAWRTAVARVE
jgi:hypothetical protein